MPVYNTVCPRNCFSSCSFKVHVEDGKVVHIDPQPANKATPEGVCIKGLAYVERANSDQRILFPMLKNKQTGTFERISWGKALELIADKLTYFKRKFGAQSVLFYTGSGMSGLVNGFSSKFWRLYGGATTVYGNLCWPAGLEAVKLTLGDNKHNAPWDLENARLIVLWGKNPAETNIQQMIPIEKAQALGAKLIVIDPRRTQSAERADLLVQIKPGTDAALALAIAKIIIDRNLHDKNFIKEHVHGFDEFAESLKAISLEETAQITDVPVPVINYLAGQIARVHPLTIVPGYGMQRYSNGGQTIRCLAALQVITGNIGKHGACFHYANLQSYIFDSVKEPESYYPPEKPDGVFRRAIPTAKLGEGMLAMKDPELKMVWVERGNPVTQNPDTNTVLKAFRNLEFRVVVDQFLTDTAQEADLVLPAKNMFEQSDLVGGYWNPYVQLKQKAVEPAGEVKPETEIYYLLAKELGIVPSFPSDRSIPSDRSNRSDGLHDSTNPSDRPKRSDGGNDLFRLISDEEIPSYFLKDDQAVENFLKKEVARFPELDFEKLKEGPMLAASHEAVAFADLKFNTPSGKIELYSLQAAKVWGVNPLPSFEMPKETTLQPNSEFTLQMLTPNTKNRIHSQFGNLNVIKQYDPEPLLAMHPTDGVKRNVKDGDRVKVYNERGSISLKVQFTGGIKPGCVSLPNGWWAQEGANPNFLSVGRETDMGHGTAFHDNLVEVELLER